MLGECRCNSCGRTELEILYHSPADYQPLEKSVRGLWLCRPCRIRLAARSSGDEEVYEEIALPKELRSLVGKSARIICMALDLPGRPPYRQIIEDAALLQERSMSTWPFVTVWTDGSTVWQAPDHSAVAVVKFDGSMQIARK